MKDQSCSIGDCKNTKHPGESQQWCKDCACLKALPKRHHKRCFTIYFREALYALFLRKLDCKEMNTISFYSKPKLFKKLSFVKSSLPCTVCLRYPWHVRQPHHLYNYPQQDHQIHLWCKEKGFHLKLLNDKYKRMQLN